MLSARHECSPIWRENELSLQLEHWRHGVTLRDFVTSPHTLCAGPHAEAGHFFRLTAHSQFVLSQIFRSGLLPFVDELATRTAPRTFHPPSGTPFAQLNQ